MSRNHSSAAFIRSTPSKYGPHDDISEEGLTLSTCRYLTNVLVVLAALLLPVAASAMPPNFTLNDSAGAECVASGGALGTTNLFTDLDAGSFGVGSGAVDEIPATNPYAAQITDGTYKNSFAGFTHGDYSIISNHQVPRNSFQHGNGIYDPVNGVSGRFFLSDPNEFAPTFSTILAGLTTGQSYEISFWAADSELSTGNFQRLGIFLDGATTPIYDTGFIANTTSVMEWKKFSFVYQHISTANSVQFDITALETGRNGRDFFFDEIKVYECFLNDFGDAPISGTTYGDATHGVTPGLRLGAAIDVDPGSLATADASGDGTDDDGVSLPIAFEPGASVMVPLTVTGPGFLNAWIDWNGNGVFDDIEQIATDIQDTSGSGTIILSVMVPADAVIGQTFARFRWSSDFTIGPYTTGSFGFAIDGEVEDYQITIGDTTASLTGTLFVDNGAGAAVAHDGVIGGDESADALASIILLDGMGTQIATGMVHPGGFWSAALPADYAGTVQLVGAANYGYRFISEDVSTLTNASNASTTDGTYSFTVAAGAAYDGLNIGLIADPLLSQNQTVGISAGGTVELTHIYTATTSASVDFSYVDIVSNPADAFDTALFKDIDCDGTADQVIAVPRMVTAGEQVCIIARTHASTGIGARAKLTYGLTATSLFTGTTEISVARNDDAIGGGGGANQLVLKKTIENVTQATPEAIANTGKIGDELIYRIYLTNPSTTVATNISVHDQIPTYTALAEPIPSPVAIAGLTCSIVTPPAYIAAYTGPLEWTCPGILVPGAAGAVSFKVEIMP